MAENNVHSKKRSKNLAVLALILGWCLLIWLVTMVRMAQAQEIPDVTAAAESASPDTFVYDLNSIFFQTRHDYRDESARNYEDMMKRAADHQGAMVKSGDEFYQRGTSHQQAMDASFEEMMKRGRSHQDGMDESYLNFMERGAAHQAGMEINPEKWWQGWEERLLPADYGPKAE